MTYVRTPSLSTTAFIGLILILLSCYVITMTLHHSLERCNRFADCNEPAISHDVFCRR